MAVSAEENRMWNVAISNDGAEDVVPQVRVTVWEAVEVVVPQPS